MILFRSKSEKRVLPILKQVLQEANRHSRSQEIHRFYETHTFMTVFTRASYWSMS